MSDVRGSGALVGFLQQIVRRVDDLVGRLQQIVGRVDDLEFGMMQLRQQVSLLLNELGREPSWAGTETATRVDNVVSLPSAADGDAPAAASCPNGDPWCAPDHRCGACLDEYEPPEAA